MVGVIFLTRHSGRRRCDLHKHPQVILGRGEESTLGYDLSLSSDHGRGDFAFQVLNLSCIDMDTVVVELTYRLRFTFGLKLLIEWENWQTRSLSECSQWETPKGYGQLSVDSKTIGNTPARRLSEVLTCTETISDMHSLSR